MLLCSLGLEKDYFHNFPSAALPSMKAGRLLAGDWPGCGRPPVQFPALPQTALPRLVTLRFCALVPVYAVGLLALPASQGCCKERYVNDSNEPKKWDDGVSQCPDNRIYPLHPPSSSHLSQQFPWQNSKREGIKALSLLQKHSVTGIVRGS